MNLSPINYQPMKVNYNYQHEGPNVNFRAKGGMNTVQLTGKSLYENKGKFITGFLSLFGLTKLMHTKNSINDSEIKAPKPSIKEDCNTIIKTSKEYDAFGRIVAESDNPRTFFKYYPDGSKDEYYPQRRYMTFDRFGEVIDKGTWSYKPINHDNTAKSSSSSDYDSFNPINAFAAVLEVLTGPTE